MNKKSVFIILMVLIFSSTYAQKKNQHIHPLFGTILIGIESGITWGILDDEKTAINFAARGTFEFYFMNWASHAVGFKAYFGAGNLRHDFGEPLNLKYRSDLMMLGAGVVYSYAFRKRFMPYVMLGMHSMIVNNKRGTYEVNQPNGSVELGFRYMPVSRLILSLNTAFNFGTNEQLNLTVPGNQDKTSNTAYLGIAYSILPVRSSAEEKESAPSGIAVPFIFDYDSDGIPDSLDECPNTPPNIKVDSSGCPLDGDGDGVPDYLDNCPNTPKGIDVDDFGCPTDLDRDGVPNYLDLCPGTPAGVFVDSTGCPQDSDGDGVPDNMDICPNTKAGVKVDSAGCEVIGAIQFDGIIKTVYFDSEKMKVTRSKYINILNELLKIMKDTPGSKWRIAGHSDSFEILSSTKDIAKERAENIKKYFVQNGINRDRIQTFGMGADYPVESNLTIEGRAKNRRAVIVRIK